MGSETTALEALADALLPLLRERLQVQTPPSVLNVPQAAEAIGRSRMAVYALIKRGELAAVKNGRRVVIERRAIDAFLEQGRTE